MPFTDLNPGQQRQQSLPPRSLPAPASSGAQSTVNPASSVPSFDFHGGSGQQDVSQGPPASGLPVSTFPTSGAIAPAFYVPEDHHHHHHHQQPAQPTQFKPSSHQHDLAQSHYAIPHGHTVIPPTPNSIELHGGAARYPRVDENEMYQEQVLLPCPVLFYCFIFFFFFFFFLYCVQGGILTIQGLLYSPHISCHDPVGDTVPPPRIHHSGGVFHASHIACSRGPKFQQCLSNPGNGLCTVSRGYAVVTRDIAQTSSWPLVHQSILCPGQEATVSIGTPASTEKVAAGRQLRRSAQRSQQPGGRVEIPPWWTGCLPFGKQRELAGLGFA